MAKRQNEEEKQKKVGQGTSSKSSKQYSTKPKVDKTSVPPASPDLADTQATPAEEPRSKSLLTEPVIAANPEPAEEPRSKSLLTEPVIAANPEPPSTSYSPIFLHQELEPGRVIIHQDFHDGRVRRIEATDAPEYGNQHRFMLEIQETDEALGVVRKPYCSEISFQKGPLAENGPNGWSESDLVAILIDRFTNFEAHGISQPEYKEILKGLLKVHETMDKRRKRKIAEREEAMADKKRKKAQVKPIIF
jgi:hypothetical protein